MLLWLNSTSKVSLRSPFPKSVYIAPSVKDCGVTSARRPWSLQECDTLVECARGRSLAEDADGDHDWAAKTRSLFCLASRAFVLCLCQTVRRG